MERNERMQWRAKSSTFSQSTISWLQSHYLPDYAIVSWWLKAVARLVVMPRECKNPFSSSGMKAIPRSECTKEGFPKTENRFLRWLSRQPRRHNGKRKENGSICQPLIAGTWRQRSLVVYTQYLKGLTRFYARLRCPFY